MRTIALGYKDIPIKQFKRLIKDSDGEAEESKEDEKNSKIEQSAEKSPKNDSLDSDLTLVGIFGI